MSLYKFNVKLLSTETKITATITEPVLTTACLFQVDVLVSVVFKGNLYRLSDFN